MKRIKVLEISCDQPGCLTYLQVTWPHPENNEWIESEMRIFGWGYATYADGVTKDFCPKHNPNKEGK